MEIYIIRHGETQSNVNGVFHGWTDVPLNDFGILLAKETGKGLKGLHFDAAFSSPLTRARQTCEIVLEETGNNCPITFDDRLKEINMGDFEGKDLHDGLPKEEEQMLMQFITEPLSCGSFPNGESVQDVMVRTQEFLKEISALDYGRILVASHGCAIRSMLNCLYEHPELFWHNKGPANCSINIVDVKDGQMSLVGDDVIFYDKKYLKDNSKFRKA